jgi:hypothetical protein
VHSPQISRLTIPEGKVFYLGPPTHDPTYDPPRTQKNKFQNQNNPCARSFFRSPSPPSFS